MPTTINGIGTTYFGKKNVESYSSACESCGQVTTLSDYETGYYICILFIPVIPLGRRMILGQCAMCTRHRVMPLKEWETIKEESISQGIDQLSSNVDDPNKALELLGTYTAFKQYDEAKQLALATGKSHPDNYDVQLALGGWFEEMSMAQEADECFQRCLKIDFDCPSSKRIRCITHLEQQQLTEGEAIALELFAQDPVSQIGPMLMLVTAFESHGQDAQAYKTYQRIVAGVPEIKEDKEFCKPIRKLEKKLGVTESIVPKRGFFGLFG